MKIQLTSFENASVLRKFTILYFVMSILPVSVLYYLYWQVKDYGQVSLSEENFFWTLLLVVVGVAIGYFATRSIIKGIIDLTNTNRTTLEEILGPDKMHDMESGNTNEIAILAKSFNEITSRLEENIRNLELAKKTLHSVLSRVGEGISSMENIDNFLNLIVETVTEALQGKVGILMVQEERSTDYRVKAVYGVGQDNGRLMKIKMDAAAFEQIFSTKKTSVLSKVPREGALSPYLSAPVTFAPLVLHDKLLGGICLSGRKIEDEFNDEEMNLLYNLGLQTAVAIENSRLNDDAEKTYFETISALAMAVEAKDPYSRGHSERVAKYVVQIGEALKLTAEELKILRDAARLHDIGKIGVTDKVLTKDGPLTAAEMDMMKKHCEIGEGIIKPIRSLRALCDLVRHHHEKIDGMGYPDGLKGDQVRPLVRILTVADIFDALTSNRSYRSAFPQEKALDELRGMKDQVDQKVVEVFAKTLV
ncbi:MAG: HD domain-containing protein [Candidatus Omnitrophota bacterium]|nr:HD domain-containing protein [Candidatus Omnitrophota bacterium]MDZ4242207.1 HD domain-containing protein [Candidatus Omnitrophota bacterium]